MKSLEVFRINGNSGMSGALPFSIGNLKNLALLDVSDSGLSGKIPLSFSNLSNLKIALGSDNNFNGPIPDITSFSKLREFILMDVEAIRNEE